MSSFRRPAKDYARERAEAGAGIESIRIELTQRECRPVSDREVRLLLRLTRDEALAMASRLTGGGLTVPQTGVRLRQLGYAVSDQTIYTWPQRARAQLDEDEATRQVEGMFFLRVCVERGVLSARSYDDARGRLIAAFSRGVADGLASAEEARAARRLVEMDAPTARELTRRYGSWEAAKRAASRLGSADPGRANGQSLELLARSHARKFARLRRWGDRQPTEIRRESDYLSDRFAG